YLNDPGGEPFHPDGFVQVVNGNIAIQVLPNGSSGDLDALQANLENLGAQGIERLAGSLDAAVPISVLPDVSMLASLGSMYPILIDNGGNVPEPSTFKGNVGAKVVRGELVLIGDQSSNGLNIDQPGLE